MNRVDVHTTTQSTQSGWLCKSHLLYGELVRCQTRLKCLFLGAITKTNI